MEKIYVIFIEFCSYHLGIFVKNDNRIGSVMVSMLASSAVDLGFESCSRQTKDYKIGICCFSA
jgi:hypothetical protein